MGLEYVHDDYCFIIAWKFLSKTIMPYSLQGQTRSFIWKGSDHFRTFSVVWLPSLNF